MLVHTKYFLNDSFSSVNIERACSKFEFLSSAPSNSFLTLELWNLRINNRVIRRSEYGIPSSTTDLLPLTSIRVGAGAGGEAVTQGIYVTPNGSAPSVNAGFDNYTKFINRIFARHGISSRFFPMGKNYTPNPNNSTFNNIKGNQIGCHLSLLENFSLTFLEKPTLIGALNDPNSYTSNTIFHIETTSPMTLRLQSKEFNSPIEFNSLVSPYQPPTNYLSQNIDIFTDKRYKPA